MSRTRVLVAASVIALAGLTFFPGTAGASARPKCGSVRVPSNQWLPLPNLPTPTALRGAGVFDGASCAFVVANSDGVVSTTWDDGMHWARRTTLLAPPASADPAGCGGRVIGVLTENLPAGSAYVYGQPAWPPGCAATGGRSASSTSGLYETADFGATFAPVPAFNGLAVVSISAGLTNPNFRVAVVDAVDVVAPRSAGNVLYTSTDGGRTWTLAPTSAGTLPFLVTAGGGTPGGIWIGANADGRTSITANPLEQAVWHSSDGGTSFQQVDDEANVNDASVTAGPGANDQLDVATGNGIAETVDGGMTWRRVSAGQDFSAVRLDQRSGHAMMAISEGVPVISRDGGRTFTQTAGLGYLGQSCQGSLMRDGGSPSLFVLRSIAPPLQGGLFGTCPKPGVWIYRTSASAVDSASSSSNVHGATCIDSAQGAITPPPPVAPPATGPGETPAPPGTVIYVDNYDGTCLVRFDRYGNATPITSTPVATEGMALDFSGNVVIATRWSGELVTIDGASGSTTITDPRAYPAEGPSFDRWGNLFITLNDGQTSNRIYEYPYSATTGSLGRRLVWSFGRHFVEDTRVAPPRSPFAGDLFVLYSSQPTGTAADAVARLHRTATGWVRERDFSTAHTPSGFQALGMAFAPDASLLLADWHGSGMVLRYSPDGRRRTVFATVPSPDGQDGPFHAGGYAFAKIDVAANGYVYLTSDNCAGSGVYEAQNALVRLDPQGNHLLPDFVSHMSLPLGIAVPNVITGLPRLTLTPPKLRKAAPPLAQQRKLTIRGLLAPPAPPANGPPSPITGPAPIPAPGLGPVPQPAQQANPVSQAQPVPQAGMAEQRQVSPQLATVQVTNTELQMSAVRSDPQWWWLVLAGLAVLAPLRLCQSTQVRTAPVRPASRERQSRPRAPRTAYQSRRPRSPRRSR
jgi:hypothetical protein